MLEDVAKIRRVILACGMVDLRKGIDGLQQSLEIDIIKTYLKKELYFFFCGRRSNRIKGLLWMGDGFLLLYKRFEASSLSWPHTRQETAELTEEQFNYLILRLNPLDPKIKEVHPKHAQ